MSKMKFLNQWSFVVFAYAALFSLGFLDNIRGAVFENFIRDLNLSDSVASYFFVVASTLAFITSFSTQNLIFKMGPIRSLRIGLCLMTLAVICFGFTKTYLVILLEAAMFGVGFGVVSVAQNVAINCSAPKKIRRQLFSGLHSMYALSSLVAPLVAGYLFALNYQWNQIFIVAAGLPVIILVIGSFLSFDRKTNNLHELLNPEPPLKVTASMKLHQLFMAAALSIYLIAEVSVSSRLVLFAQRTLDLPAENATLYLVAFFGFLFIGRILFAVLEFEKISTFRLLLTCLFSSSACIAAGLIWSPWWITFSGFTMGPFFPSSLEYVAERFQQHSDAVMGYIMGFASMTVVVMHFAVGVLSETYGIALALWVGPVALIVSSVVLSAERLLKNSQQIKHQILSK